MKISGNCGKKDDCCLKRIVVSLVAWFSRNLPFSVNGKNRGEKKCFSLFLLGLPNEDRAFFIGSFLANLELLTKGLVQFFLSIFYRRFQIFALSFFIINNTFS